MPSWHRDVFAGGDMGPRFRGDDKEMRERYLITAFDPAIRPIAVQSQSMPRPGAVLA
jgi:hypothetical protein